jgi:hypothetical protein
MPTDPSKQAQQILEIPPDRFDANTVNDRIQQINLAFQRMLQNPALGDANLGTSRIVNLADPKDDLDGVNLRTLKRFSGTGIAQQTAGSGIEFPTVYFTFDGLPFDGEVSPYAPILANRAGFSPVQVGVCAVVAPSLRDAEVNLTIFGKGQLLKTNLILPIGSIGPTFSTSLALPASFPGGTLVQAEVVHAGGCSQITIGLSIRGH